MMAADLPNDAKSDMREPTVLIIADDLDNLALVASYLEDFNFTILVAEDGESGLKIAASTQPDLILLDIMMPGIDGDETCRRLKALESTKDIPVIFMTALGDTDNKVKGFVAGADDYITKPIQREDILARVGVHLRIRELMSRLQEARESLANRVAERTVALRNSETRLADIINLLPDATFAIDLEGKIILWNRAAEKFTGVKAEEMLGKGNHEYSIPFYGIRRPVLIDLVLKPSPEIEKLYPYVKRENGMVIGESYTRSIRHGEAYILGTAAPLYDSEGNITGAIESIRDITLRKKSENALRESEWKFRAIFDQQFQFMGLLTVDGTTLQINRTALRFIGIEEPDVLGKPFWETPWWTHSPEQQERLRGAIKAAAHGEVVSYETTHPAADGSIHYIDFSLKPVKDETGNVVYMVPEGHDITERKRSEAALREAAVKYRIVADNTYNWEFWLSPEGRFIYTSPSCRRISGYEVEEFNADPGLIWSIVHPDDRQLLAGHRHDITQTNALGEVEFRIFHRDGDIRWIHHVCMPVFDDNGMHLGTRGSFSDITNRKQAEEKNLRLAAIVESSDDAVIGKTVDGIITSWNRGAAKIFGYSEGEVVGKSVTILVPSEYKEQVLHVHERVKHGEHVEHFETVSRRKDGGLIQMSLTYSPVRDAQGRVVAVSTIGRDITEQKKAEAALLDNARINRELEIAKEIQQSFLPTCPSALPGMLMTCCCVPAAHVGGDYYDFFTLEDGIVDAVIADVTGHSVGSSLLMTMTRSVLHAKVSSSRSPGTLLAAVNDLLHDDLSRAELLISMFYIRLDTENHTLAYANAGHNPAFLFRAREGAFIKLDADGLLMGVKTDVCFEEKFTLVETGDIIILYTDGVTEAENVKGELFGTGRLRRVIADNCERHPQEIMTAIFRKLAHFRLSDDVAMIIFKIV
ncbi:MAG: PAS domain S-box protein [Geobacteraceae bacterium]|nr:PAS domain S-box protein [Geobacteraceae bacterium]